MLSPMVGQSELTYRQLLRSHGAQLTYTPMVIASQYIVDTKYRSAVFTWDPTDKPLVVQLCATNADEFLAAAKLIIQQSKPDAIELNLGCPQSCAERGGYGSWMMDKQATIQDILTKAVDTLPVAITAKIRVFPTLAQTFAYVDMLANTGISLLTVHPRQRHHREEVLADWDVIEQIRTRINIPVVLNGDIWGPSDLAMAMCLHQVDGYMCAQGALQMPTIFKTIAQFVDYNRPKPQQDKSLDQMDDNPKTIPKRSKHSPNGSSSAGDQTLVQLQSHQSQQPPALLPDLLVFQSTKSDPFTTPKQTHHYRVRKDLGCGIQKQPLTAVSIPPEIASGPNIDTKISRLYESIPSAQLESYHAIIKSYPITPLQSDTFNKNPLHLKFVSVILHFEANIDQCKRQLQNAVEYVRLIEKYPVHHHSIAQRHLFFILFDLLNKHVDCYDLLYVATDITAYKDVIHLLHKKAAANADFAGCLPDNYFTKNHKERTRRRDGTLSPPPWPVGGGGFNVAMNSAKNKSETQKQLIAGQKGSKPVVGGNKNILEVGGKQIDMSKFD